MVCELLLLFVVVGGGFGVGFGVAGFVVVLHSL